MLYLNILYNTKENTLTFPKNLILIRHGQSEANILQEGSIGYVVPATFGDRHDSHMRLTDEGRKQATTAGQWMKENLPAIDVFYTSPHIRTRETAAHLNLNGKWIIDDLWRERDWGEYGNGLTREEQKERFPYVHAMKKLHAWYWRPAGGESLATDVRYRAERTLENLREYPKDTEYVLGVSHGEFITTMRFVLEHPTVEAWADMNKDKQYKITNCSITHYTRVNPETNEEQETYGWVRMINPVNPELSPDNGQWRKIATQTFNDSELLATVSNHDLLLTKKDNLIS